MSRTEIAVMVSLLALITGLNVFLLTQVDAFGVAVILIQMIWIAVVVFLAMRVVVKNRRRRASGDPVGLPLRGRVRFQLLHRSCAPRAPGEVEWHDGVSGEFDGDRCWLVPEKGLSASVLGELKTGDSVLKIDFPIFGEEGAEPGNARALCTLVGIGESDGKPVLGLALGKISRGDWRRLRKLVDDVVLQHQVVGNVDFPA